MIDLGRLIPWRFSHLGGPLNTLIGVHLRRPGLRRRLRRQVARMPDDVTVLLGHRNRADYRLHNALRSLRAQDYAGGRIHVLVVDYGSNPDQLERLRAMADPFSVECVAIAAAGNWSRAHCLNIGIRRTTTKFLVITDVDVMFAANYVREAVAVLKRKPLSVVYSRCVRLPESAATEIELAATRPDWVDLNALRRLGQEKTRDEFSTGMVATHTHWFQRIHGYDEFYTVYGVEDADLAERFRYLGLREVSIGERSFYLHQWHPKHEGVRSGALQETIQRNQDYFSRTRSIVRNPLSWGEAPTRGTLSPAPPPS